jgi:2-C-methyl-D-erythritol 4-phosphate cytidylyltransferase
MADPRQSVDALILAAGRGERLGLGPKALLVLAGRTLLDRAIEVMRSVAERVIVGVPEECVDEIRAAHTGNIVILAGGKTRMETLLRLFHVSTAPLIVQHDIVHPFVTPELARRVVAAARKTGAAMAAVRSAAHVYRGEARLAERIVTGDTLWLARKPLAFARLALARTLDGGLMVPDDAGTVELLLSAHEPVEIVPVEPWNIKLTTPEDWTLAQALESIFPVALHATAGKVIATDVGLLDSDRRRLHHGPAG